MNLFLKQLNTYVENWIKENKNVENTTESDLTDASYYNTFDSWNNYLQTISPVNLEKFLPEWGMTNLELRKFIWCAEHNETSMSYDEFRNEIKTWKYQINKEK